MEKKSFIALVPGLDAKDDERSVEHLVGRRHDAGQVKHHEGRDDRDCHVRRADLLVVTPVAVLH